MRCPHCDATLRPLDYEGVHLETCDSCHGEWLDAEELKHVIEAREQRFSKEERQVIANTTSITGVDCRIADRDLHCPKCDGKTDAINYGGDTGIIIDKCTECGGIWLDKGELEKIQMLVEAWEQKLPEDVRQHQKKVRLDAQQVDAGDDFGHARYGFVNAAINGVLDIFRV